MGRHSAGDGVGVDPIVAAALDQRPTSVAPGAPRHGREFPRPTAADREGGLGWPGEPGDGTGLGWPGDLRTTPGSGSTSVSGLPGSTSPVTVVPGAPLRRRGGWRRLFGGGHSSAA